LQGVYEMDGRVYGINMEIAVVAMVYVPELFQTAGVPEPTPEWTVDDYVAAAKALTIREGDEVVQWGSGSDPGDGWWRDAFLQTADAPLLTDPTTVQANHPDAVALMQIYQDLRYKDKANPDSAGEAALMGTGDNWFTGVYEGKVAMVFVCCGTMREIDQYGKKPFKFAHLPRYMRNGNAMAGTGYFVYSQTDYPAEATEAMLLMNGPEVQPIYAVAPLGATPSLKSVREEIFVGRTGNPDNWSMLDQIISEDGAVASFQLSPKALEIFSAEQQAMAAVWDEGKPVPDILDDLQAQLEDILAREE
jgi:ABC-type glycerol-3-phosphate transport system substrate-binding protein